MTAVSVLVLQLLGPTTDASRATAPCVDQVAEQRRAWHATGSPRPQPPGLGGGAVWHWPTRAIGVWVVESHQAAGAAVSLQRVTSSDVTTIAWTDDCRAATTVRPRSPLAQPRFTDADLERLLADNPRGLIYVWSPHMPLSVDGVATIRDARARRDLPVTVLLDPNADRAAALSTVAAKGWPSTDARVANSTELLFRDVLVHAPSVQAYAHGALVGSPYPGYHTVDEYRAFVDRVLPDAAGSAPGVAADTARRGLSSARP